MRQDQGIIFYSEAPTVYRLTIRWIILGFHVQFGQSRCRTFRFIEKSYISPLFSYYTYHTRIFLPFLFVSLKKDTLLSQPYNASKEKRFQRRCPQSKNQEPANSIYLWIKSKSFLTYRPLRVEPRKIIFRLFTLSLITTVVHRLSTK